MIIALVIFAGLLVVSVVVLMILMIVKPDIFAKNKNKDGEIISEEVASAKSGRSGNSSGNRVLGDTKSFVPINAIDDYSLDLGNYNYRAIVEVSSVNFDLLSEMEQTMVEQGYHRFLNSLDFPVELYIQTRELDMDLVLKNLDKNIANTKKKFDSITKYGNLYREQLGNITEYIGNSKTKKKYIILTYNNTELKNVSSLKSYEIKNLAIDILMNRCSIVMAGISGMGLRATLLNKSEIAECLYAYYHRNSHRIARDMAIGMYDTLAINGETEVNPTDRMKIDLILNDCQNRIKTELITASASDEELKFYNYIYSMLEEFKQDDRSSSMGDLIRKNLDNAIEAGYEDDFLSYIDNNRETMAYSNFDAPEDTQTVSVRYMGGYDEANVNYKLPENSNNAGYYQYNQSSEYTYTPQFTQYDENGQNIQGFVPYDDSQGNN